MIHNPLRRIWYQKWVINWQSKFILRNNVCWILVFKWIWSVPVLRALFNFWIPFLIWLWWYTLSYWLTHSSFLISLREILWHPCFLVLIAATHVTKHGLILYLIITLIILLQWTHHVWRRIIVKVHFKMIIYVLVKIILFIKILSICEINFDSLFSIVLIACTFSATVEISSFNWTSSEGWNGPMLI